MIRIFAAAAIATALLAAPAAAQASMTNQGVIDLVKAKMNNDTVLAAIRGSKPAFDTSSTGIISLSKAGVPEPIIQEMIRINTSGSSSASVAPVSGALPAGFNPEQVVVVDNGVAKPMQYLTPQIRTAARALGFGGVAQYASLQGTKATLRTSNKPTFQVAVPNNAQVESYVTLANFEVRKNGTREVLIGGGYISYSSGITKDRVVPITSTKAADQSKAPANFTVYDVTPVNPLKSGEYAFVVYSSAVRSVGYFATGLDSYFDFGVD